ncbi:MAG TPA: hypothetical protein VK784_06495, partial [Pseudonocardiaceae bacterium]|nr:hypothetical protein [Pseudonocardiaceae bacterium]
GSGTPRHLPIGPIVFCLSAVENEGFHLRSGHTYLHGLASTIAAVDIDGNEVGSNAGLHHTTARATDKRGAPNLRVTFETTRTWENP